MYYEQVDLSDKNGWDILKLLVATDELDLLTLGEYAQNYLINTRKDFLKNDPIGILGIIFQHETFAKITDFCLETDSFLTLSPGIFEMILKREDLELDEIEVWDYLIKWIYVQFPNIKRNPAKWTKK